MAENPYESTEQPHAAEKRRTALVIVGRILLCGAIIAVLVALLLPAKRSARGAARRNVCLNNMKQILLALHNYNDVNGELPPAYTVDDAGNRLHSWRALILPYMEGGSDIAELIDYTKPWDDPANAEARKAVIPAYRCPSATSLDEDQTTYVAVIGPEFLFSGSSQRTFDDVADGASYTIAVVEVGDEHAVHWMSPDDVDESLVLNTDGAMETGHNGVFLAGYLDGHAEAIEVGIDHEVLRGLLTIAGRETLDDE